MVALKLIKKHCGRRRFVKKEFKGELELWDEAAYILREQILTSTNLQIVGPKTILEFDGDKVSVLIEILGLPTKELQLVDFQERTVLIYRCPESVFEADFKTMKARAREIQQKLANSLEEFFHLVLDGHKIELHFFMQKDYIQASI